MRSLQDLALNNLQGEKQYNKPHLVYNIHLSMQCYKNAKGDLFL